MARTKKVLEKIKNLPSKSIIKKCNMETLEALAEWCDGFKTAVNKQIDNYEKAKNEQGLAEAATKLAEAKKEYNSFAEKLGKEKID